MKRTKKLGRRGAGVMGTGGPPVIGGVTLGSTRRPPGTSRTGAGRLGRALSAAKKNSAPRAKTTASTAKAGQRWKNDVGKAASPAAVRMPVPKHLVHRSKSAPEMSVRSTPLSPDPARQRKAKARVKGSSTNRAGITNRLLGHVSGNGKRNQARRDSKNG